MVTHACDKKKCSKTKNPIYLICIAFTIYASVTHKDKKDNDYNLPLILLLKKLCVLLKKLKIKNNLQNKYKIQNKSKIF